MKTIVKFIQSDISSSNDYQKGDIGFIDGYSVSPNGSPMMRISIVGKFPIAIHYTVNCIVIGNTADNPELLREEK